MSSAPSTRQAWSPRIETGDLIRHSQGVDSAVDLTSSSQTQQTSSMNSGCIPSFRRALSVKLDYELPKTVASVREGWQWTCQSGAVVSGLLAAVAAQLLATFKSDPHPGPEGAYGFLLATCYAAIFLNIGATISSFILIDNLGEIGYQASSKELKEKYKTANKVDVQQDNLLIEFGASREWKWMLFYWLATFYSGILAVIVTVITYVWMVESLAIQIVMTGIVFFTLIPSSYFIFGRPLIGH